MPVAVASHPERRSTHPTRRPAPMRTAIASWFDDSGATACGTHSPVGFAHLPPMRCGTRVRFCARRCVTGIREDAGPYVAGREFDLTPGLKAALGCSDLCRVRWRTVRR